MITRQFSSPLHAGRMLVCMPSEVIRSQVRHSRRRQAVERQSGRHVCAFGPLDTWGAAVPEPIGGRIVGAAVPFDANRETC